MFEFPFLDKIQGFPVRIKYTFAVSLGLRVEFKTPVHQHIVMDGGDTCIVALV